MPINSIGFDRIFRPLAEADPFFFGRRFKAAEPPCKDQPVGAVQEGAARCSCAGLLSGWVAPAVVLDIFGALSLAWKDPAVLNDPPS